MTFDWSDYLRLAKDLAKNSGEAELRSAISRAYYSIFQQARKALESAGIPIKRSSKDHSFVPRTLKRQKDVKARQLGEHLKRLRVDRNKADYDDDFPDLEKQVELDLLIAEDCQKIIAKIVLK